jgi:translin
LLLQKSDVNMIQKDLANLDAARDAVFDVSRIAVRFSGRAIVELHRGDLKKANEYLGNAASSLRDLEKMTRKKPGLKYLANVTLAYQEYAEAKLLYNMMIEERILSLDEVGVEIEAYLLGLLDFVGELRRMCLNYLRAGQVSKAEYSMKVMEGVYEDLYSIDHTAIIANFRHKMDAARRIIETTRGDVVTEVRRLSLETALKNFEEKLLKSMNP